MIASTILPKIALGASLLGATAGVVGALAVLRKRALAGDMLAHAALPGVCLAYMLFSTRSLIVLSAGALATGVLGVVCMAVISRWTRTREDASMALVLSTFFGAGVVLLTVIQQQGAGSQAGLNTYLFGEVAGLRERDVALLAVVALVGLTAVGLLYKELQLLCFDRDFARAQGWPTVAMDIGVMTGVALVTVVGLPICGVVLMAAMLILPCVAARFWSNRLGVVLVASGVMGAGSALIGVTAAAPGAASLWSPLRGVAAGMPPGPLIVLAGAAVFVASALFAPQRGLLSRAWHATRTRLRMARDHLLRLMFERNEPHLPERIDVPLARVTGRMSASPFNKRLAVLSAVALGLLEKPSRASARLTPAGLEAAARVTRVHRLWERFLVEHADIAADHVHRDADDVEHLLPDELVDSLEEQLRREGRLPLAAPDAHVPTSPHEVRTD